MTNPAELGDPELLDRLGVVAREADPVPEPVFELGRATFAWRRLDDLYAELVADSLADAVGVRAGDEAPRLLTFEHGDVAIDVQISVEGERATLLGVVMRGDPGGGGQVDLETPGASTTSGLLDADDRFSFSDIRRGLVRLRLDLADEGTVTTSWFDV